MEVCVVENHLAKSKNMSSSTNGWTQVYLSGLEKTSLPTDEDLETLWEERYGLSVDASLMWAGKGTSIVKRSDDGICRGYAFLSFLSLDGATRAVERINNSGDDQLRAEISKPKKKQNKATKGGQDYSDIRLRRQRKAPVAKHPVIVSSNGKKTGLGNKTR